MPKSATEEVVKAVSRMDPCKFLKTLEPGVDVKAGIVMLAIAYAGYGRAVVMSGRRSLAQQQRLYARGRSEAECKAAGVPTKWAMPDRKKVTWLHPEDSKHLKGEAFDFGLGMYREPDWQRIGKLIRPLCKQWGGDWKEKDYGHCEW